MKLKEIINNMIEFLSYDWQKEKEENYLNESTSIMDLEMRMREIERNKIHGRNF